MTKMLCLHVGVKMAFDKCVGKGKKKREMKNIHKRDEISKALLMCDLLSCL